MAEPYYEGPHHGSSYTSQRTRADVVAVLRQMPGLSVAARQALISLVESESVAVFRHRATGEWMVWQHAYPNEIIPANAGQSLAEWYAAWFAQHEQR